MNGSASFPPAVGVAETGIARVAVIGAGAMGGGIAAQFANAGVRVELLDVPGAAAGARNEPAQTGIDRQLKTGGFMHPDAALLVRPGNIDDHLHRLAKADWIVEAIIEKLDVKRNLFARIDAVRRKGSIVSSNTSTIPRASMIAGMPSAFAADFFITHFFNPPRHMQLVEIIAGAEADDAVYRRVQNAAETVLGKTVVACRDTPGFIANRIGCHWLAVAVIEAERLGITPEQADAVMQVCGMPRTGAFGLMDLVGIDLVPQVWGSLMAALPPSDDIQNYDLPADPLIADMLANGRFGRKAKAGFYRLGADKARQALDLASREYRPEKPVSPQSLAGGGRDMPALICSAEPVGVYAWRVLSRVIAYAAAVGEEIAGDVESIDVATTLGYAWKDGPFRLADRLGAAQIIARLQSEGRTVPPLLAAAKDGGFYDSENRGLTTGGTGRTASRAGRTAGLAAIKLGRSPIVGNDAASLWDSGDGVAIFEVHTKLNSFAPEVLDVLEETTARGGRDFRALVLGNDDPRAFSVGADLGFILGLIRSGDTTGLSQYIERGQRCFLAMKYAPYPVVAAGHGLALGGGCEITLYADAVVAHAEFYAGLPETRVGLLPGWGGCTQVLLRNQNAPDQPRGPLAPALRTFTMILEGGSSSSAWDAMSKGPLRLGDSIVMNRDHLLAAARRRALALVERYAPPAEAAIIVTGASGKLTLMNEVNNARQAGRLTDTDVSIAEALATVVSGGVSGRPEQPMTERALMRLEREALVELSTRPATAARIEHMLATGKPLRN